MADVTESGPFSLFPGVERTLAVLRGNGLHLRFGQGETPRRISASCDPITFAGDIPAQADLIDGAVQDLNVMTRRGAWRHSLVRVAGPSSTLEVRAPVSLLLCDEGIAQIETATSTFDISAGDAVRVEGAIGTVEVQTTSIAYFIELWPQHTGGDRETLPPRAVTIN